MLRQSAGFAAAALLCCAPALAQTGPDSVPKHLALARQMVENLKPEDNYYKLGGKVVAFPGDFLTTKYVVATDCSGFVLALFDRAGYRTSSRMTFKGLGRAKPLAEDFLYSIEHEKGFRRIHTVRDIQPGDVLAHEMSDLSDQKQALSTGHVMIVDTAPRPIKPRAPIVPGTDQFEVRIIDSNTDPAGPDDTRLADRSKKVTGAGRGTIRLYADSEGVPVGWARTFKGTKRFFSYDPRFPSDTKRRRAAVGRPVPG